MYMSINIYICYIYIYIYIYSVFILIVKFFAIFLCSFAFFNTVYHLRFSLFGLVILVF